MTDKTEDQIAREKDAVQKMIGAKSAMEAALTRITTLERTLGDIDRILSDMSQRVGDGLGFKTYHHGKGSGEDFISIRAQCQRVSEIARKVL